MAEPSGEIEATCIVAGCNERSSGVLAYASLDRRSEQPLCEHHSSPLFHLRPLDAPAWTWVPHDLSGSSGVEQ